MHGEETDVAMPCLFPLVLQCQSEDHRNVRNNMHNPPRQECERALLCSEKICGDTCLALSVEWGSHTTPLDVRQERYVGKSDVDVSLV